MKGKHLLLFSAIIFLVLFMVLMFNTITANYEIEKRELNDEINRKTQALIWDSELKNILNIIKEEKPILGGYFETVKKGIDNYDLKEYEVIKNLPKNSKELLIQEKILRYGIVKYNWIYKDISYPVYNPLETYISSEYGNNKFVLDKVIYDRTHAGIDIVSKYDLRVICPADGIVIYAKKLDNLGNCIKIEHLIKGIYYRTLYGHLSEILVLENDKVKKGQIIGIMGNTGEKSSDTHLHFEIRKWFEEFQSFGTVNPVSNSLKRQPVETINYFYQEK